MNGPFPILIKSRTKTKSHPPEILPFFTRLELENGEWMPRYWPPNFGATRDLPPDARIHKSVQQMHKSGILKRMPKVGGDAPPAFEDPIQLIRVLARQLLPWNWRWFSKKSKPKATTRPNRKVFNPKVVEIDGAKSWNWDVEAPLNDCPLSE